MKAKVTQYTMIFVLLASLSCKKEPNDSDLVFTETCDFSGYNAETVNRLSGTLTYTDNIYGQWFFDSGYNFVINVPGHHLSIVVCNMPPNFEMAEGESRSVTFSGRMVVFSENVDATNTWVELNYLKFE